MKFRKNTVSAQTIADTLGIGGIFRALRTNPVVLDFIHDMEAVCPNALFINYTNPMAMITGAIQRVSSIPSIGLCHSVQVCVPDLMRQLGMEYDSTVQYKIAGINHQAWLLEVSKNGVDLYPEIKRRSLEQGAPPYDRVRHEMMHKFGYYITESSEHTSEYLPYFIKSAHPELIERFNIPLDEYPRRCIAQIEDWKHRRELLVSEHKLEHVRTHEYASYIIESMVYNRVYKLGGNVLNHGLITNLPQDACVEVPCLIDASGVQPVVVGDLPPQLAALNRTNINPQLLTIEAALTGKKEYIYHAAMLDPHTSAELTMDEIRSDVRQNLIEAARRWLPAYK